MHRVTIERHNVRRTARKVLTKLDEPTSGEEENVKSTGIRRASIKGQFVRHLENMLVLASLIARREEPRRRSLRRTRKPDFPNPNDEEFLRTTLAARAEATR
jgi:succinate dehydrogenase / fumarate reductase flavoprotein subunit